MKLRFLFCAVAAWSSTVACATPSAKSVALQSALPAPVPPLCADGHWAWSADGSALVASCERGVEIREGTSGLVRAQWAGFGQDAWAEINADASVVARPRAGAVELRSGKDLSLQAVLVLDPKSPVVPLVAFSADGTRLAALQPRGPLVEVSLPENRVLWRVDDATGPSMPARLRYVGETVYVSMSFGQGRAAAFSRGLPVAPRWMRQDRGIDVHRSGQKLLLFPEPNRAVVWDVATDRPVSTHQRPFNAAQAWVGDYVATEVAPRGVELTRSTAPQEKREIPGADVLSLQVTADGAHLRARSGGDLMDWTLPGLSASRLAWSRAPAYELLGNGYFVETRASSLTLRSADQRRAVAQMLGAPGFLTSLFATSDGELAAVEKGEGTARILRIAGRGPERRLEGVTNDIVIDPHWPRAAYVLNHTIHVIDTRTLTPIAACPEPADRYRFQLRSAQNQLVVSNRQGRLSFIDFQTGRVALEAQLPVGYGELVVSPNGEYVAHSGHGLISVWSAAGVRKWDDPEWQSANFSADSRTIRLLSKTRLVTHELATSRTLREEAWPSNPNVQLIGDWLLRSEGELSIRRISGGPWRSLAPPALTGVSLLGARAGDLLAFDRGGSYLRLPLGALHAADAIDVPDGTTAHLSPDGSLLSIVSKRRSTLFDLATKKELYEPAVAAWALDGSAFLKGERLTRTNGSVASLELAGALAFGGNAHDILASVEGDIVLYDARTPTAEPRSIAHGARLVAQSADQLTIALTTDSDRRLSLLRAPNWQAVGQPIPINGAKVVSLSSTGNYLAVVNETNELQVYFVGPRGPKAASLQLTLPPAPAVSSMLFTPDTRFLVLEGTPLRFLRLADGDIMNVYIARAHGEKGTLAPILYVDAHGQMEGDAALARQLYCESLPIKLTPRIEVPPCAVPRLSPRLATRFFDAPGPEPALHAD